MNRRRSLRSRLRLVLLGLTALPALLIGGLAYQNARRTVETRVKSQLTFVADLKKEQMDELVWQDVCEVLMHPELITHALERAHGGHWLPQELQARRDQLRKGRVNLDHQLDRLSEAYLHGIIPLAEFERRRRELEQKGQALDTQAKQLEAHVDRQAELAGLAVSLEAFCQRVQTGLANATFEQQRQLVELLIDRVIVTNDQVEIRYVIPTSPSSEQVRFCHLRKDYFHLPSQQEHLRR